jgi:hypothetical protein
MRNGFTTLSMQIGRNSLAPVSNRASLVIVTQFSVGKRRDSFLEEGGCKKKKKRKEKIEERNTRKEKKGGKRVWNPNEWLYVVAVPKAFYKVIWMGLVSER